MSWDGFDIGLLLLAGAAAVFITATLLPRRSLFIGHGTFAAAVLATVRPVPSGARLPLPEPSRKDTAMPTFDPRRTPVASGLALTSNDTSVQRALEQSGHVALTENELADQLGLPLAAVNTSLLRLRGTGTAYEERAGHWRTRAT